MIFCTTFFSDLKCTKNQSHSEEYDLKEEVALVNNLGAHLFSNPKSNEDEEQPETTGIRPTTTTTTERPRGVPNSNTNTPAVKVNRRRKPYRRKVVQIVRNVTTNSSIGPIESTSTVGTKKPQTLPTTQHAMSTTTTTTQALIPSESNSTAPTPEVPITLPPIPISNNPRVRFPHMRFPHRRRPTQQPEKSSEIPPVIVTKGVEEPPLPNPLPTTEPPIIIGTAAGSSIERQQERREPLHKFQPKRMSKANNEDDENAPIIIAGIGSQRRNSNGNKGSAVAVSGLEAVAGIQKASMDSKSEPTNIFTQSSLYPRPPNLIFAPEKVNITLKELERTGSAVTLKWDSTSRVSGFRIIYRRFGDEIFSQGPPLAATEREYTIRNVPHNVSYK